MTTAKDSRNRFNNRAEEIANNNSGLFGQAHTLSRNMSKLVNRKLFSDVHFFVGPEREKIYGHRCVLAARNEIFRQLLFTEPVKASYDFLSVGPVSFLLLIYFLYTNSISFDRLDIYEVLDLMKTAETYKCVELEKLAELQITFMLEPKTAFEFLTRAHQMNREVLKTATKEYIEEYSAILLNPGNQDFLVLNPTAMQSILESNLLDIDELQVVEVACVWAENYLARAKERAADSDRGQLRASIVHIEPSGVENSRESVIDAAPPDVAARNRDWMKPESVMVRQAYEDVARVMHCIRLSLLQPNDLAKLEEMQLTKKLIPEECFINAWRQLALQPQREESNLGEKRARRAPVARSTRSKSISESSKRNRSMNSRMND